MDLTGRHLGKYELIERVGRGGMAYVYKAYQPTVERHVAVKVLHSHLAEDGQFLERFKREAKGLGSLRHPHIVSVIDFDVDDSWYYMVMDFIKGETLEAMLKRRGRLPVDEALGLIAQLAGALDYAHRHGRVHRDIKPSNIMFADDAQQHAVITDFGLTRLIDNVSITISGTVAGTPAYMSPEAAQGQKVDARGDIYSLGVILYEMVTGQRPYEGETPLSVIMKLVLEPLPPALSINPDLPPAVDEIIRKATAKQPEERYQSAAEMREAVLAIGDWRSGIGVDEAPLLSEMDGDTSTPTQILPRVAEEMELSPVAAQDAAPVGRESAAPTRLRWLPLLSVLAVLVVTVVIGFTLLNGAGSEVDPTAAPTLAVVSDEPATDATPPQEDEATPAAVETPAIVETVAPQIAGTLSFAGADENGLRPFTLALDNVPAPPAGSHYELWFDLAGQIAPHNVAALTTQGARIDYTAALSDTLAASVTGVRVSLEPDFDDDPTISGDVVYTGTVEAGVGLAEIAISGPGRVDSTP